MCPPVNGSREEVCPGRHMGRPPRFYRGSHQPREERAGTEPRPYRSIVVCSSGPMYRRHGLRPYGEKGKPHRPPWPAEQSICASGHKGWVGHAAEIIPKVSSNLGQSLNRGIAATAPFAQGSLALRGTGPRWGAPGVWLPPAKFQNRIWGVGHGHPALRDVPTGGGPPGS